MALSYYNSGTATATNGSATVVGVGTLWLANVRIGDWFVIHGRVVRILSITDNTHLVLAENWSDTTVSASVYEIRFPAPSTDITQSLRTLLDSLTNGILTGLANNGLANSVTLVSAASGSPVAVFPAGVDTNIGLDLKSKGTGSIRGIINGSTFLTLDSSGNLAVTGNVKGSTMGNATRTITLSGSGTYTTPAGVRQLRVRMWAAGGGGGGWNGASTAGTGGTSSFGSTTCIGGSGGTSGSSTQGTGGIGGTGGVNTGATNPHRIAGQAGGGGQFNFGASNGMGPPTTGGASWMGAGHNGTNANGPGGGGAGAFGFSAGGAGGGGGGGGEFVDFYISTPAGTYSYAVGAAGAASTGGSVNGTAGAAGTIVIEEIS